jgi:cytoskeletal protein RodZ
MQKILLNAMLVDSLKSMSGSSGMLGSLVSGVTGYLWWQFRCFHKRRSGTALQEYSANLKFNALGGVYDSFT